MDETRGAEIECRAPEAHPIAVWIEPWGDVRKVAAGDRLRLVFEGELVESVVVEWMERGISIGVPRYALLSVLSGSGETLGQYDTRSLPPLPPGARPG